MPLRLSLFLLFLSVPAHAQNPKLEVLSSPPNLISGDTALVQLTGAGKVTLNGRDVTVQFRPGRDGAHRIALLTGLKPGANVLEAREGAKTSRLTLTTHPAAAPLISGPHQSPFVCQTAASGLGEPLDANCTVKPQVAWFYRSKDPATKTAPRPTNQVTATPPGFKPFDPKAERPSDMARITTLDGETVDYIVRREIGTINRAIYQIAILHDPRNPEPDPWTKSPGWNGRLVYSFGGGCRAGYRQGQINSSLDSALANGFAAATSSLNVLGNNCNDVLSAETLLRVKEHFIRSFGPPAYTIGTGGSGGSIQQHLIAQNYPGLLDGIIPSASFPDIVTVGQPVADCALLNRAMNDPAQSWTPAQKTAVSGFATWGTCESWLKSYSPVWLQPGACDASLARTAIYDKDTNPKGTRCTTQDNQINIYGRDPQTGFARRIFDNQGVQYGLAAFNSGAITAEQFVTLNERAGGFDLDGNLAAARSAADPEAVRIAHRTGRVDRALGSLPRIPILDVRQYIDAKGDIHDSVRSFSMRARLQRANGTAANHVMLVNPRGVQPVLAMDKWLANIARDTAPGTPAEMTVRNKPADLVDACWTDSGERIAEPRVYGEKGRCNELFPPHADPRIAAGAPLTDDVIKCALKPVTQQDYHQPFTADQLSRLKAVFPQGVCDYSRPAPAQELQPQPWMKF